MRGFFPTLLAAALLSVTAISPAHAAIVLDQDAFVPDPSGPPISGRIVTTIGVRAPSPANVFAGQSVTAGLAGRLSAIELQGLVAAQPDTVFGFTLFTGDIAAGGIPIGFITGLTPLAGSLQNTRLDVSVFGLDVTPGQIFSFSIGIVSGPPNANGRLIIGNFAGLVPPGPPTIQNFNNYAGGVRSAGVIGSLFVPQLNGDLAFRTFVDTGVTGVPEPQSWAMMILGFGLVGGAMRRRRVHQLNVETA
jgi:PEP-CTERM motif